MTVTVTEMPPPRSRYPWEQWTDGRPHRITQGTDFTVEKHDMRAMIYGHARRHRMTVEVRTRGQAITFQFTPPAAP